MFCFEAWSVWAHFKKSLLQEDTQKPKNPLLTILGKALKITRQTHFSTTKIKDMKDAEQSFWTENIWFAFCVCKAKSTMVTIKVKLIQVSQKVVKY